MKIFPAIDIKDKKCVRLIKGNFDNKTEYEISPVDQAKKYKDYVLEEDFAGNIEIKKTNYGMFGD